uniref:Uncharacterized protein n=1 Tax=Romanomermis culicivorax TaxID=13658 RepID=A0A915JKZ5_ROMCU
MLPLRLGGTKGGRRLLSMAAKKAFSPIPSTTDEVACCNFSITCSEIKMIECMSSKHTRSASATIRCK